MQLNSGLNQVELSAQAEEVHLGLKQLILDKIRRRNGRISFAEFMQMSLYAPELGYYQNALHKLGEQGDFVTAPEISQLFGQAIAGSLQDFFDVFAQQYPQRSSAILELGAGNGSMAAAIIKALANESALPSKYFILEPSASLQSQQFQLLTKEVPELIDRVEWLASLPTDFNGVILANEVVDAIPCERIIRTSQGWQQMDVVELEDEALGLAKGAVILAQNLPPLLNQLELFTLGYQTEFRPQVSPWLDAIYESMQAGSVLLFDYGYPQREYYHPQRDVGTLKCFSRHQANHEPLQRVGLQDISAHVDFTELAESASCAGFDVMGFTTQAGFLLENDILNLAAIKAAEKADTQSNYALSQQLQKLMTPGQMGELVKAISLNKACAACLKGFQMQDHLYRL
ncbi:class I SAM-dependent methyltransferase [Aliikangiella sp. IMCC44653]